MIKGIGKQIILLNNTDSAIFEQAIFILRSGEKAYSKDVVKECERMMNLHLNIKRNRSDINKWKIGFFIILALFIILLMICILK